tara:strand:+ start:115 stop:615 length:501 start_codon:yes stop_codon:yes gene_type:complete
MKNKKGFLLAEETLKIILAVISIGFLVYFLTALYFANQNSEKLEQAKASLEHLIEGINSEIGEVEIYNPISSLIPPESWILISFPLNENIFPDKCNEKECLCICDKGTLTSKNDGLAKDCDSIGICMESNFKIKDEKIKIENPPLILQINYGDKIILTKKIIKKEK